MDKPGKKSDRDQIVKGVVGVLQRLQEEPHQQWPESLESIDIRHEQASGAPAVRRRGAEPKIKCRLLDLKTIHVGAKKLHEEFGIAERSKRLSIDYSARIIIVHEAKWIS